MAAYQITFGFICAVVGTAQVMPHERSTSKEQSTKQTEATPVHVLDFKLKSLVAGVKASPALTIPFQCSSNGAVLVNMINPMHGGEAGESTFLEIKGDRRVLLDTSLIRDVSAKSLSQTFFYNANPILFVYGRRNVGITTEKPPRAPYLLFFGPEGQYQRSIEIKNDQITEAVAVLPTGDLLVSSHDIVNRQDTLAIYGANGSLDRPLDQPMTASERKEGYKQGNPTTFVNHGSNVIAYRQGTRNAILEIGPKNTVREIPLALPPGAVIADMVSSDDSLIVHSFLEHKPGQADNSADGLYYEFDPLDGSLIRMLKSSSPFVSNIACKLGGEFTAYVTNKESQFMRMSTD